MRRIQRPPVPLPTLAAQGRGGQQAVKDVARRSVDAKAAIKFLSRHWNEPDVRGALFAMHGRVCAYCQCGLPHNDPGDVEHFRPKSAYWWLAYSFDNYLLSCAACNRSCKRERFPLAEGSEACNWSDRDRLCEEKFLLLNPVSDPVEDWLQIDYKRPTYWVRPASSLGDGSEPLLRTSTTIEFFKLNVYVPLRRQRIEIAERVREAIPLALEGDPAKIQQVRSSASRFRPMGVVVRHMLAELAPQLVPTEEEDLINLVLDFVDEIHLADEILAASPHRKTSRFRQEVLWALAVLWRYPPVGSSYIVETCLEAESCRDEVAALVELI